MPQLAFMPFALIQFWRTRRHAVSVPCNNVNSFFMLLLGLWEILTFNGICIFEHSKAGALEKAFKYYEAE
jgi:hypothetical protein